MQKHKDGAGCPSLSYETSYTNNSPSRFHIPAIFLFSSIENSSPYLDTTQNFLNQKIEILQKSETESAEIVCVRGLWASLLAPLKSLSTGVTRYPTPNSSRGAGECSDFPPLFSQEQPSDMNFRIIPLLRNKSS